MKNYIKPKKGNIMNNSNNIQRYSSFSKAFSSIAFLLISSYSYSQTYTDYYFIPTTGGNATLNLAENYAVGSPDGEAASEIPGHNTNVFISADADGYTANTNYHNFNAHNVTFKVGDAGTGASGAWFLLTENNTASITGDFLFSARSAAEWSQIESGVKVLTNSNFSVTGDFIIENNNIADADNAGFKFAFKHHSTDHTNGTVYIGGNLLFRSVNKGTDWPTERIEFITKVTNFSVNGYVDLTQPIVRGSKNNLIWDLKGSGDSGLGDIGNIQIGGLRGDGALKLSKENSTVNMEFRNSQNYEWAGTLSMIDASRLNITMYANESNAKQTLRFGAGSEDLDLADGDPLKNSTRHTPDSVTVENGILEMNTSGNVCGTLSVIGRDAAFGATGISSGYEDGTISFASVNWSSGGFIFDIIPNIASGDVINAVVVDGVENSGTITVADGASDLKMTFNLSAADLQQFLFDEGLESYESTIMTWETSSNLGDYLDYIQILSDNGVNVALSILGNSLVATFTVPEPHETAALIGAIALFAVLARRRMRR